MENMFDEEHTFESPAFVGSDLDLMCVCVLRVIIFFMLITGTRV